MAVVEFGSHLMAVMKIFNGQGEGPSGHLAAVVTFTAEDAPKPPDEDFDDEWESV